MSTRRPSQRRFVIVWKDRKESLVDSLHYFALAYEATRLVEAYNGAADLITKEQMRTYRARTGFLIPLQIHTVS